MGSRDMGSSQRSRRAGRAPLAQIGGRIYLPPIGRYSAPIYQRRAQRCARVRGASLGAAGQPIELSSEAIPFRRLIIINITVCYVAPASSVSHEGAGYRSSPSGEAGPNLAAPFRWGADWGSVFWGAKVCQSAANRAEIASIASSQARRRRRL